MKQFNKILIANRGEIAVRIIRTAKKMGIKTVAIYSVLDRDSLHTRLADETYCIGMQELNETYLNIDKIIKAALQTSCDAIHPGYGFLAENPLFIKACEKNGLTFIGPNERAIRLMGNKIESRSFVKKLGIPMTEGLTGSADELIKNAAKIPLPLLVKAAAGGGGKGMKIVHSIDDLENILESTSREAKNYFGNGTIYIEKYVEEPRHIEFQVMGDNFGNIVHLFERECTIQRRYQKIIEESPSPTLSEKVRKQMGDAALRISQEIGYNSAGTIEFLVDKELHFYFLEMNTRIQVEHPVTEMVTGVDLIEEQIWVAAGNKLRLDQKKLTQTGHAIECRIYAEDPANNFMPSPGKMTFYLPPAGKNIRLDSGLEHATTIQSFYDPMISKLVVWGENRELATKRCVEALQDYLIHGIHTNIEYLLGVMKHRAFSENNLSTRFCDEHTPEILNRIHLSKFEITTPLIGFALFSLNFNRFRTDRNVWKHIGFWRNRTQISFVSKEKTIAVSFEKKGDTDYEFEIENKLYSVQLIEIDENKINFIINPEAHTAYVSINEKGLASISTNGKLFQISRLDMLDMKVDHTSHNLGNGISNLFSPMPGKVIKVNVKAGDKVVRGSVLIVVEAMKMENNITAEKEGIVEQVAVKVGDMVDTDKQLVFLEAVKKEK